MTLDIHPVLPLESFREQLGYHPFWFYGMSDSTMLIPSSSAGGGCRGVVKEYSWQDRDFAGRAEIRRAIARAERRLAEHLKFYPAPIYREETVDWPRLADRRFVRGGPSDADWRWLNIKLSTGYVQSAGVEARTLIQAGISVNYTDTDGDGYDDMVQIGPIATTAVTDVREVAVYFVANDRFGADSSLSERWRIAPLLSTISGGQLTITGPAWIFVAPKLQSGVNAPDLDPNAASPPFVGSVDVYRRYTKTDGINVNTDSQAVIIWETRPWHGWWCCCGTCNGTDPFSGSPDDPAAVARAAGRVGIRNSRRGVVTPAETVFNATDNIFAAFNWDLCEQPDRVMIRYQAGYPLDADGQMHPKYRELVAILAAAELGKPISGCAEANRQLYYWQQDLAQTGVSNTDLFATTEDILNNPFGTRRGHVYAWRQVIHNARGEGIRAG